MINSIESPNFPDVPTMARPATTGTPSRSWYGLFVPTRHAVPIVDKLPRKSASIVSDVPPSASATSPPAALSAGGQYAGAVRRGDQRDRAAAQQVVKDAGLEPQ